MKRIVISLGLCVFMFMFCFSQNNQDRLYRILLTNNIDSIKENINAENVNHIFHNGYTPLMLAIENDNLELVQFLVNKGADVNLWVPEANPLLQLAEEGNYALLKRHEIDESYKNTILSNGYTPLMLAVRYGNEKIVRYLIEKGADVNMPKGSYNPLLIACLNNNLSLVRLLAKNKAELNILYPFYPDYTWHNRTPLMYAIGNRNIDMIESLIEMGANIDFPQNSYNPLIYAIETGLTDIVSLLIQKGCNVNTINVNALGTSNKSAIMYALSNNNMEIIDLLLSHGASVKGTKSIVYALTLNKNTPLNMRYKMVERLIEAGADVNAREGLDGSLFPLDAALPYPDIYDLLIKNGATQFLYDGIDQNEDSESDEE